VPKVDIYLTEEEHKWLVKEAKEKNVSFTALVNKICWDFIVEKKKKDSE